MSAYRHPESAVRREMRRLRKGRDYPLWVKALARVVLFTVIWAAGAIALHILAPSGNTLDFPSPPAQEQSTDVTGTPAPHPATTGSHP